MKNKLNELSKLADCIEHECNQTFESVLDTFQQCGASISNTFNDSNMAFELSSESLAQILEPWSVGEMLTKLCNYDNLQHVQNSDYNELSSGKNIIYGQTSEEHYVPRHIIKNWADDQGYILKWYMPSDCNDECDTIFKSYQCKSKSVFFENNIYELRDNDKSIIYKNFLESEFAKQENILADLLLKSIENGFSNVSDELCKSCLCLQILRSRSVIDVMHKKFNNPFLYALSLLILQGFTDEARLLVTKINGSASFGDFNFDKMSGRSILNAHMNQFDVVILKSKSNDVPFLLLSDPVLINSGEAFIHDECMFDYRFIFPIHPYFAIGIIDKSSKNTEKVRDISDSFVYDIDHGLLLHNFDVNSKDNRIYAVSRTSDEKFFYELLG